MKLPKLLTLAAVATMCACANNTPVETFVEPKDPVALSQEQVAVFR